jgi:flagellar hook-basal body complex protein FliE
MAEIKGVGDLRLTPENVNQQVLQTNPVTGPITPFHTVLEEATEALQGISNIEFEANRLTDQYLKGKASIEEVMMATAKLNMAMSFALSVVSTSVQTFKEIQQIPI